MPKNLKNFLKNSNPKGWSKNKIIKENINLIIKSTSHLPINAKLSERIYCILNDITKRYKCLCGNYIQYTRSLYGYKTGCDENKKKCLSFLKNWKLQIKNTNLKRYGVENVYQAEEIKDKIKNTNLKRYGVKHAMQSNIINKKSQQTCIKKYGVKNAYQSEEIKDKIKKTKYKKYNDEYYSNQEKALLTKNKNYYNEKILNFTHVKPIFLKEEFKGVGYYDVLYNWKCLKCNTEFKDFLKNHIPICKKCHPTRSMGTSIMEYDLGLFISKYINIEKNKRFYYNSNKYFEIDIYIPEKNIGIEFNGIWWHSELAGKDKNYHINKTNYFKEKGIQIIHIFENEWILKQPIVKSIILNKIGKTETRIFGRKCKIKEISTFDSRSFLQQNHIQGAINSSIRLGLFYEDKLVSLMTFGKSRYNKNYKFELHRFCNLLNTTIIGGFSKLLKYFINNFSKSLISYADIRYSNGNVYNKNGFELINTSSPNYWYFKSHSYLLESRIKYQKHKLKNQLEIFKENFNEWENMQENGFNRIFDCGNYVFVYKVNN